MLGAGAAALAAALQMVGHQLTRKASLLKKLALELEEIRRLIVHPLLFGSKLFLRFADVGVFYAAVYRSDAGALGLFVKTHTFGALI